MNIALFYYDGFSEFEVVLIALLLKDQNFFSIALENREYRSEEQQRFNVDKVIKEVDIESLDMMIIPGGNPAQLIKNLELKTFIEEVDKNKKIIGGICGGSSLLAGLGILKGKRCTGMTSGVTSKNSSYIYYSDSIVCEEHVVIDGNLVTAQGQAYVEFALELVRQLGLYENEEEYLEDLKWLKNIR
jgi:putative intracellular protease/amidase